MYTYRANRLTSLRTYLTMLQGPVLALPTPKQIDRLGLTPPEMLARRGARDTLDEGSAAGFQPCPTCLGLRG